MATAPQATRSTGTPISFEDAVKQYQARFPGGATRQSYEGLFDHLKGLGFNPVRPTRSKRNPDGSRMLSSDKIVDGSTGQLWDIIASVDDVTGSGKWAFHHPKDWGYWVDGKASRTPIPGSTATMGNMDAAQQAGATVLGAASGSPLPQHSRPRAPGRYTPAPHIPGGSSTVLGQTPVDPSNPYAAAQQAAMRTRAKAPRGGRSATILGGFAPGKPKTRQSVLGAY